MSQQSTETAFYVSLSGDDSWSGKLAEPNSSKTNGPFATLEKARDAIRGLKKAGPLPDGCIIIGRNFLHHIQRYNL